MKHQHILFLDVDGVLNRIPPQLGTDQGLNLDLIFHLFQIVIATECKIVLSSAWRYMGYGPGSVFQQALSGTLTNDQDCLKKIQTAIIGATPLDLSPYESRHSSIYRWLQQHDDVKSWIAIDDDPSIIGFGDDRYVITDPQVGITLENVTKITQTFTTFKFM